MLAPGQRLSTAGAGITGRGPGDGLAASSPALAFSGRITPKMRPHDRDDTDDDVCLQLRRRHAQAAGTRACQALCADDFRSPAFGGGLGPDDAAGQSAGQVIGTGSRVPGMPGLAQGWPC
jgi:hypothetical protein